MPRPYALRPESRGPNAVGRHGPPRGFNDFRYADLNTVLVAASGWCDGQGGASSYLLEVVGWRHPENGYWQVKVLGDELRLEGRALDDDLRLALMAACVEAAGKLRGGR